MAPSYRTGDEATGFVVTSVTLSINNSANDDSVLITFYDMARAYYNVEGSTDWNGTTLTDLIGEVDEEAFGAFLETEASIMVAPAEGTYNCRWLSDERTAYDIWFGAVFYDGVDQDTPYDGVQTTGHTNGNSFSVNVTSETDDLVITGVGWNNGNDNVTAHTPGAGATFRQNATPGEYTRCIGALMDEPGATTVASGSSVTMKAGTGRYAAVMFNLNQVAAAGGGATTPRRISINNSLAI